MYICGWIEIRKSSELQRRDNPFLWQRDCRKITEGIGWPVDLLLLGASDAHLLKMMKQLWLPYSIEPYRCIIAAAVGKDSRYSTELYGHAKKCPGPAREFC